MLCLVFLLLLNWTKCSTFKWFHLFLFLMRCKQIFTFDFGSFKKNYILHIGFLKCQKLAWYFSFRFSFFVSCASSSLDLWKLASPIGIFLLETNTEQSLTWLELVQILHFNIVYLKSFLERLANFAKYMVVQFIRFIVIFTWKMYHINFFT